MQVLENFKHAETFAQMTLGDKMIATMYVIALGMGITFVALVLIWGMSALMSKIILSLETKSKLQITTAAKLPVQVQIKNESESEPDEALIAVITAAIAASLNTSMHHLVVTNIIRIQDDTPVWGSAGRINVMGSRI